MYNVIVLTNTVYFGKHYTLRYIETKAFWKMFLIKLLVKTQLLARYFDVEYMVCRITLTNLQRFRLA